jgi:hypothetical protein
MFCSQCGNNLANGAAACPRCGAAIGQAPSAQPTAQPGGPGAAGSASAQAPTFRFEVTRWSRADEIAGGATLLLFISLFLPWFGVSIGGLGSYTADGLTSHGYLYITLILSLAIIGYLVLIAGFEQMPFSMPLRHEQVLLGATGVNLVLVLIAFLFKPGSIGVGWRFGAFVGLIAAIAAFVPLALPAFQARRAHT